MNTNNITFKGNYDYSYNPYSQNVSGYSKQPVAEDKQKSNAAKYMIGATALAGVVALGVAGYKGHLGKGVQNFMKNIGEEASKLVKKEPPIYEFKNADSGTGKIFEMSDELKSLIAKSEGDFSALEKYEHPDLGYPTAVLKKFDNGKPQYMADGMNIYEFDKATGNLCRRMEKGYRYELNDEEWIASQFISKIEQIDLANPRKVLSTIKIDSENNITSFVKNVEWNADLQPLVVEHYEDDMKTLKCIMHNEYDGNILDRSFEYATDGKTLLSKREYYNGEVVGKYDYFRGTKKVCHYTGYKDESHDFIDYEIYYRKNGMKDKEFYYDETTHNLKEEYRYHKQAPKWKFWQEKKNVVSEYIQYDPNLYSPKVIGTTYYDKKGRDITPSVILEV